MVSCSPRSSRTMRMVLGEDDCSRWRVETSCEEPSLMCLSSYEP